jgi:cardiolipin synthase
VEFTFAISLRSFRQTLFYIGRRLHHKIVVADAHVLLIGGINIANKYHGKPGKEPWLDYAVQIDDPIIAKDFNYFARDLFFKKRYFSKKDRICFKYKERPSSVLFKMTG